MFPQSMLLVLGHLCSKGHVSGGGGDEKEKEGRWGCARVAPVSIRTPCG